MTATSAAQHPLLVRRMWLLLLMDASERAGTSPLSVAQLHRLIYLANALAPIYDLPIPDGYILKYRRGPFFPIVHWDIGRLVTQGLVIASQLRPFKDRQGYWIAGSYRLSGRGAAAVDTAITIETVFPKASYLREIGIAFATLGSSNRETAALADVNYEPLVEDTATNFGDDGDNLAPNAAEALIEDGAPNVRRLRLHRYFRYLELAWQEQKRAS